VNRLGVFLGEDLDNEECEDAAAPKINLNAREKERTWHWRVQRCVTRGESGRDAPLEVSE